MPCITSLQPLSVARLGIGEACVIEPGTHRTHPLFIQGECP